MIDIRSTSVLGALYSRGLEHKNGPGKFTIHSGSTTTTITIDTRTYLAAAGNFRMPQVHLGGFRKIIFVARYLTESCMGDAAGSSSQVTWEFGTSRAQSFIRRVVAGRWPCNIFRRWLIPCDASRALSCAVVPYPPIALSPAYPDHAIFIMAIP